MHAVRTLTVIALLGLALPLQAGIRLDPIVSGLSAPRYVDNARDSTFRMFIAEQAGLVRVLQPAATTPTTFLDIRTKVIAGGEQGLLGLAFHPLYYNNGRFFVFYTRAADGALVVSEFKVSSNPNVADTAEKVLLTIPHPGTAVHNGGRIAFGPDRYLWIATGDGGSANDPSNNAQNIEQLLGKILRIDVDQADTVAGTPYSSPFDNPFVNRPGRDEIFALGFRNPHFSFDRLRGQMWVGDPGQRATEEINSPIVSGGNYGWRVYEGTACTNNDPALCNSAATYLAPLIQYGHDSGRCAVVGGNAYRGPRAALPSGTYVYADACTGEIFAWNGTASSLLLKTSISIVSFGEDEQGELYVVDTTGAITRIASDVPATVRSAIEYYHAGFDHYFVTTAADEISKLDTGVFAGWVRTGQSFNVYPVDAGGLVNVCRFFSASFDPKSSHFYTPLASECALVKQNPRWQFEGEVFSVILPFPVGDCPADWQRLYRLYNAGQGGAPNHRYTTNLVTMTDMQAVGWISEGYGEFGVIACARSGP